MVREMVTITDHKKIDGVSASVLGSNDGPISDEEVADVSRKDACTSDSLNRGGKCDANDLVKPHEDSVSVLGSKGCAEDKDLSN